MTKPRVASPMKLESHTRPGWAGPGRERGWKCGRELAAQADGLKRYTGVKDEGAKRKLPQGYRAKMKPGWMLPG